MPAINMHPKMTAVRSTASFDGSVEPMGATGYKFSGTLKASCQLDRSRTDFKNTIRLGHGGTSKNWIFVDRTIDGSTFEIEGEGERADNETVEFSLNLNEGISGQFSEIAKLVVTPGGPPQQIRPDYTIKDENEHVSYYIRLDNGSARADGPTGFVIEGWLDGAAESSITTQYGTLGYKGTSGAWVYTTLSFNDLPKQLKIVGNRRAGESIQIIVGATSLVANLYAYGSVIECALPEQF